MNNDKLTELGVLVVYAADALEGLKVRGTRERELVDAAFSHLDHAAGALAELLHLEARPRHLRRRKLCETAAPLAETGDRRPETVPEAPAKKKRGRKPNPICPRCKVRPKAAGKDYCAECARELQREYQRRRTQRAREQRETPEAPPADPAEPSAPIRHRGGSKNAKLYSPDAPETAPSPRTEDAKTLYDRMIAECKRRGYDPDLMLGLAQALPKVDFRKSGGYLVPVWHGKISGRSHMYHPDEEEK